MAGRKILFFVLFFGLAGLTFLLTKSNSFTASPSDPSVSKLLHVPEGEAGGSTQVSREQDIAIADIEPQKPLPYPPATIKAIYVTSWTASNPARMDDLIQLIDQTELNAVVIDIKDFSGLVAYDIENDAVDKYGAKEVRIPRINALIKQLHDNGIYVIARQTVFQDPALVKARPDLAVKNAYTGKAWTDRKGLSWVDPASQEVWDYNIAIAKDAAARGFDEINFDYVRFPSDGSLEAMQFPFYDEATQFKKDIIRDFFMYLNSAMGDTVISADLFGLSTVAQDDLGIGQVIEDAYLNFDFVAPMVYPSHYAVGTLGFSNPAAHPYEIVNDSMTKAIMKQQALQKLVGQETQLAKLRPWLQDFDLGTDYNAAEVRAQIQATYDAGVTSGWMLWDPRNEYTRDALSSE